MSWERVKCLSVTRLNKGMWIPLIGSRTNLVSCDKRIGFDVNGLKRNTSWMTWEPSWVSRSLCWLLIGEVSRSCLCNPGPIGCHT